MIIQSLKKYGLSGLLCIVILILCLMNTQDFPEAPMSNFDKLVHTILFLAVSGVVFFDNTARLKIKISERRLFLGSLIFPIVFSGLIEILQEYCTLYRTGDWMDWVFDSVGAATGWIICWALNRLNRRRL
ncbi:membrane protein [Bacteroidia bacterium]|nr:membrane protein [Bacteroidia bacterium]